MTTSISWRCPFCGQIATIQDEDIHTDYTTLEIENDIGRVSLLVDFTVCPNKRCKKFTLSVALRRSSAPTPGVLGAREAIYGSPLHVWELIPQSMAKVLPDYIPKPIVDDYLEACAIKDLSAKASATLSRRCLQGMIRDFWQVTGKRNLAQEIAAIEDKVDKESWDAINAVREVGNIGAHMEQDINVIVDVDPQEAGLLISLIETLVDEWYVARHDRKERMGRLKALGQAKQVDKKGPAAGR